MPPWADIGAVQPAFARRVKLRAAARQSHIHKFFVRPFDPIQERSLILSSNTPYAGPIHQSYGAAFGLEVRDPTTDVRLLEYCFGIPNEIYTRDGGERMLVRRAMDGLLPPEVQWNTIRGRQAADVALRLLDHRDEMNAVLARMATASIVTNYIDLAALRSAWEALETQVTPETAQQATTLLLRGVLAGLFLQQL
jgi:asparagine synthase (glutamine-hydrolysing)